MYDYLLFDLPADHEIETDIVTEGQVIESILGNRLLGHKRKMGADVKRMRIASVAQFKNLPAQPSHARARPWIVHLTCHATSEGIALLGGDVKWGLVGRVISKQLRPLHSLRGKLSLQHERVMVFSCCNGREGFEATEGHFSKFFSGAYFFEEDPTFHDSLAAWSMFYLKVSPEKPHGEILEEKTGKPGAWDVPNIVDQINEFLGKRNKLVFQPYQAEKK